MFFGHPYNARFLATVVSDEAVGGRTQEFRDDSSRSDSTYYSALNASIGSSPAARSAGAIAARIVTITRVPATTASVNGSYAETPCSIATTNRVVKNSAITPNSNPQPSNLNAS